MFGKKTLKGTLAKVTAFVKEIEDGIEDNETANEVLAVEAQKIADEKAINDKEIEVGKKLLDKLQ